MIDGLWLHTNQDISMARVPVDQPYKHNVRSEIFCWTQEEHDYLSALNLMHGRDIAVHLWKDWLRSETVYIAFDLTHGENMIKRGRPRVLPIAYTTKHINLRGF